MELMIEFAEKNDKGENKLQAAEGFKQMSDPIYGLTSREQSLLKSMDNIQLDKTNSGNFRVRYTNGTTLDPHVLSIMCKAINAISD